MDQKNHSALLGRGFGIGGDYYIGTQAVSDKKFDVIKIGTDGATLVGVQIGNQDVTTAKNLPAALPGGYLICADGKSYIYHIELSSGWAEGFLVPDWVVE
jgi:hypothetical protein